MPSKYGLVADDLAGRLDEQRLIELTDDEASPSGVRDDAVCEEAIRRAESEFESYAGRLYALPVSPVTESLTDKLLDSAAYYLMTRKPELLDDPNSFWRGKRKEILAWLTDVAKGTVVFEGVAAAPPATNPGSAVVSSDSPRLTNLSTVMHGGSVSN